LEDARVELQGAARMLQKYSGLQMAQVTPNHKTRNSKLRNRKMKSGAQKPQY
jgi:hypothetical protein